MAQNTETETDIDTLATALEGAGYEPTALDGHLIVSVGDEGDDDPEAAAALAEIRQIVEPLGGCAEWNGEGNTDGTGYTTSDVRVEPVTK
jgi:hypothetical protein